MQRNYFLLLIFIAFLILQGCGPSNSLTDADESWKEEQYASAADLYKKAYANKANKAQRPEIAYKIATSYVMYNDYAKAEQWYKRAIAAGYKEPKVYMELAQVLKSQQKYPEALVELENYKREAPSDPKAEEEIKVVSEAVGYDTMPPKTRFTVETFRLANSGGNDFAPFLHKDGMIFTSDREEASGKEIYGRTKRGFEDLFILPLEKKGKVTRWGTPIPVEGTVNTGMNDGTATFDAKGSNMYYTSCNPKASKEEATATKLKNMPNTVIMQASKKGKEWQADDQMPFCTDTTIDYGHPTVSPDGSKMIFVMDGPYGKGKHDLYLTTYVKGSRTWSDPVNLGDMINTPNEELYPYFFNDTTLYFASNGHVGLGGLDIFVSYGRGAEWTKPKHLTYPLNSGGDDFGIVFDQTGLAGYFSSNRPLSRNDDIYSFSMSPLVFTLSGIVTNSESGLPLKDATVTLTNQFTGEKKEVKTDAKGFYKYTLKESTDYEVYGLKSGFFPSDNYEKTTVGLELSADLKQDLILKPPVIILRGILYALDSAYIRKDAAIVLDSLVDVLNTYPSIVIELGSHTDCRADSNYNMKLSQRRADSAVAYLVNHGIEADRIVAKGYGENELELKKCACDKSDPGNAICSEAEHQQNRRTTVKVLRWDYVSKKEKEEQNNNGGDGEKKEGE